MWIDEAGKEKILSELDPEMIIRNFEKYSNATAASLDHLNEEERWKSLDLLRRLTVSFIETEQGEYQPLDEAFADIRQWIKEKHHNEIIYTNNKSSCQKRYF